MILLIKFLSFLSGRMKLWGLFLSCIQTFVLGVKICIAHGLYKGYLEFFRHEFIIEIFYYEFLKACHIKTWNFVQLQHRCQSKTTWSMKRRATGRRCGSFRKKIESRYSSRCSCSAWRRRNWIGRWPSGTRAATISSLSPSRCAWSWWRWPTSQGTDRYRSSWFQFHKGQGYVKRLQTSNPSWTWKK